MNKQRIIPADNERLVMRILKPHEIIREGDYISFTDNPLECGWINGSHHKGEKAKDLLPTLRTARIIPHLSLLPNCCYE